MSLKPSMQVSMATLTVETTRHCHNDRDSGDIYLITYTYHQQQIREEDEGAKAR